MLASTDWPVGLKIEACCVMLSAKYNLILFHMLTTMHTMHSTMHMFEVFSDYGASSEYPVGLLVDTPGSQGHDGELVMIGDVVDLHQNWIIFSGPWTYYLAARVSNLGTTSENPSVVVGYSGSLFAMILSASR